MLDWVRRLFGSAEPEEPGERRARLVSRKHAFEGEIRQLQGEVRAKAARGEEVGALEARITALQAEHYRLRLEIDRTR